MAYSEGKPLILSAIADSMPTLSPEQSVAYAPTAGVEQVREDWKKLILRKNPSLKNDYLPLPVVTTGLTGGIFSIADMFLDEGAVMIASDPCWDNYSLIFETRRAGSLKGVPFFAGGEPPPAGSAGVPNEPGLDMDAIGRAVREEAQKGQVRIILNFPNNPSGYSPTKTEADAFASLFLEAAEGGADILIICDDAYFGLFYEDTIFQESLFSKFAKLHERILAVKVDGPIKEDYVWGLRTGFVTFGSKGLEKEHYDALILKLMGAIRSSASCVNTPAQHIVIKALEDPRTPGEKIYFNDMMQRRYRAVKRFVGENRNHPVLTPLPFNSGYFMCFAVKGLSAEALRLELLAKHGIGVVSLGENCLRIAFSGVDEDAIPSVYRTIYDAAAGMADC
jgi:aspartate/methionine/tyrosine aminotransferase